MVDIRLDKIRKEFEDVIAVNDLDYVFGSNEVTCLLGPSGCGKTTLLRMIAGLLPQTSGDVYFGDLCVNTLKPRDRNIGMVFQYPVVFSGINVKQNIELPLIRAKLSESEIKKRTDEVVELLDLKANLDSMISELDNGTRQKVAVARAVARHPQIILFDEPITNIDATSKLEFMRAFKVMTENLKQTIIYVTHDQTEAMTLADKIALMKDGNIIQYDDPRSIYCEPESTFGGWFLGNPGMNFFSNQRVEKIEETNSYRYVVQNSVLNYRFSCEDIYETVTIGIRPEDIQISTTNKPGYKKVSVIRKTITIGGQLLVHVLVGNREIKVKFFKNDDQNVGDFIFINIPNEKILLFDTSGKRLHVKIH
jgi:ABC-type sugar transport system ATPase subunit